MPRWSPDFILLIVSLKKFAGDEETKGWGAIGESEMIQKESKVELFTWML